MMAHRLPTVMAFVINLGVPPLLFAQVLYGRALYTSSVLIGAYWISVIFLLMASYYGLYYSAKRAEARRPWTATGLAALLLALTIAFIYSNNMTLMLRPQVWAGMYREQSRRRAMEYGRSGALCRAGCSSFGSASPRRGRGADAAGAEGALRSEACRRFLCRAGGAAMTAVFCVKSGLRPDDDGCAAAGRVVRP